MDTTEKATIDAPVSAEAPAQDTPAAAPAEDVSSRKRSREADDEVPAAQLDEDPAQADDANPSKRSRNDDGSAIEIDEPAATTGAETTGANDDELKLSKHQLRKMRREQHFQQRKEERKSQRKEKRHEKAAAKRDARDAKAEELAQALGIDKETAMRQVRNEAYQQGRKNKGAHKPTPIAIIIDCDFEKYMRENELVSLAGQVTRGYSMNRNGTYIAQYLISSWGGKMRERFETVMNATHQGWKGVKFVEGDYVEAGKVAWDMMHGRQAGKPCPALGGPAEIVKEDSDQPPRKQKDEPEAQESKDSEMQESDAKPTEVKDEVMTGEPPAPIKSEVGLEETSTNVMNEAVKVETSTQPENEIANDEESAQGKREDQTEEASQAASKQTSENTPAPPPFSTDSIIYLSADSPHTIDKLEPYTSYVIGGLVDRNREKFLCQRRAEAMGIRTAKLPIGEYLQMSSRKVLATNHVVEIMSKWLETGDWAKALMEVIPQRKGGQLKNGENDDNQDDLWNYDGEVKDREDQEMVDTGGDNEKNGVGGEEAVAKAES